MSLASICTALAGVSVTAGGKTPLTYEPNGATRKLKARFETADLPARIILPFGTAFSATARALTIGGTPKVSEWRPVDLLLWESVGQQRGIIDVMPDLAAYIDAYNTAIRAKVKLTSGAGVIIENWTFAPDLYTYGDLQCWGVEVTLVIKETL